MAEIILSGQAFPITLPDFATREEIVLAWGEAHKRGGITLLRVLSASIGLCTRVGRLSGADYLGTGCNVLGYGGAVYQYLREKGVNQREIHEAGNVVIGEVSESLFPRQDEVDKIAGN